MRRGDEVESRADGWLAEVGGLMIDAMVDHNEA